MPVVPDTFRTYAIDRNFYTAILTGDGHRRR